MALWGQRFLPALALVACALAVSSALAGDPREKFNRDPFPLTRAPSLSPEAQLMDQDMSGRSRAEEAMRRDLILTEECPLVLFFGSQFASESPAEQKKTIPEHCQHQYQEWRRTQAQIQEEPLRSPASVEEVDYAEKFDDTSNSQVEIDADGLAWGHEKIDAQEIQEPEIYVVVEDLGNRWDLVSGSEMKTVKKPERVRTSLLPQYSRPESLRRYKQTVGRSIASEFPIVEAPNSN